MISPQSLLLEKSCLPTDQLKLGCSLHVHPRGLTAVRNHPALGWFGSLQQPEHFPVCVLNRCVALSSFFMLQ